jgi:hypothetical protein
MQPYALEKGGAKKKKLGANLYPEVNAEPLSKYARNLFRFARDRGRLLTPRSGQRAGAFGMVVVILPLGEGGAWCPPVRASDITRPH